jgi:hypothetical protein
VNALRIAEDICLHTNVWWTWVNTAAWSRAVEPEHLHWFPATMGRLDALQPEN